MSYVMHLEVVVLPECGPDAVRAAADSLGWRFAHRFTKGESAFEEEIWEEGSDVVRLVTDDFMGVLIVRAESELDLRVPALLHRLGELVPLVDADGLLDLAASDDPTTRSFGLRALAGITTHFDANVFELIAAAAGDVDPHVRRLGLRCIARYPWRPFATRLDAITAIETVPELLAEQRALATDLRDIGRESA